MNIFKSAVPILVCVILMGSGCAPKTQVEPLPREASLAVAGFSIPDSSRELFPESKLPSLTTVDQKVLHSLDQIMETELETRERKKFRGLALVRQCREIVLQENPEERLSALRYWSLVGRCIPADYLLVPQLFDWQERQGGEWGTEQPARVVFDLYLLDVRNQEIENRFHFEQEQQPLFENLLSLASFLKRHGRWISAKDLAREGIVQGIRELGL